MKSYLFLLAFLTTDQCLHALPIDAIRTPIKTAHCDVDYPDEDQHSETISWNPKQFTYCGVDTNDKVTTAGAAWWLAQIKEDAVTMTVKCRSGSISSQWGSWTEVDFSVILIPAGKYSTPEAQDKGCKVPTLSDACICVGPLGNSKKVEDCFKNGGQCLFKIRNDMKFFRCEADPAQNCETPKFSEECGESLGRILHIPDSPACRY